MTAQLNSASEAVACHSECVYVYGVVQMGTSKDQVTKLELELTPLNQQV